MRRMRCTTTIPAFVLLVAGSVASCAPPREGSAVETTQREPHPAVEGAAIDSAGLMVMFWSAAISSV